MVAPQDEVRCEHIDRNESGEELPYRYRAHRMIEIGHDRRLLVCYSCWAYIQAEVLEELRTLKVKSR